MILIFSARGNRAPLQFHSTLLTDIGRKRQKNQDNGASVPELGLFLVADGMGGHQGGETASQMLADVVPKVVRDARRSKKWHPAVAIIDAIENAHDQIFKRSQKESSLKGMGTTATALLFTEDKDPSTPFTLTIGHVGDSRCYFFRPGAIWQLTRDHSLVQEKLRAGLITREGLRTDSMKNVITRSVGFEPHVNVDVYEMAVQPGDLFMLCSDGLSGMIEDRKIMEIVQKEFFDSKESDRLELTSQALIAAANENGGDDNITAVLIQIRSGNENNGNFA